MRLIQWNNEKNDWLLRHRGVCFEQILILWQQGNLLDIVEHPNQDKYPGQMMAIVEIDGYAYLVPYVQTGNDIFLKTIIPSRKATNKYLRAK